MGQFISTNRNDNCNDELINTLIKREYIHTINVEKAFRSVDRGLYYTSDNKQNAYRDTAWQFDKIHLSAPSIYATVLECLNLQRGHKFLNIGSGVGYFSTLAGLLLGVNGVNHGIEIHNSLIDIAYTKLEEFKQNAAAIDYFEFCEPVFIEGNAFELLSVGYYDRVYCGAAVPPAESSFMKSLIKVGGVLVMPMEGFLVKFVRTDEYTWKTIDVLEVSFTDLVIPEKCDITKVAKFPSVEPLSLQELCRSNIRASIRNSLNESFPDLQMRTKCKPLQSYDQKYFNSDDPLNQFVRIQYGATEQGMLSLRNIVDTFAGLDDAISDTGSISAGTEANRENNDGDNNSDDDDNDDDDEKNTSEQRDKRFHKKVKSDTKRKSPEAGCSKQIRKLPGKPKNTKRMRMNTFSTVKNHQMSQSSNSTSDLWDTMSSETLSDDNDIDDDSESWVSSEENDDDDDNSTRNFNRMYDTLYGDNSRESESDSEAARELILYRFLGERKDNELSKLLKVKIDLLPVPILLKRFLNYVKP